MSDKRIAKTLVRILVKTLCNNIFASFIFFTLLPLSSKYMYKNLKKNFLTKVIKKNSLIHFETVQHHLAAFGKKSIRIMCFYSSCSNTCLSLHVIIPIIFGEYMYMLKVKCSVLLLNRGKRQIRFHWSFWIFLLAHVGAEFAFHGSDLSLETVQTPTSCAHVQFPLPLIMIHCLCVQNYVQSGLSDLSSDSQVFRIPSPLLSRAQNIIEMGVGREWGYLVWV